MLVFAVIHKSIVEVIASSDDLNIVDVVSIDSGETYTAIVHLAGENLVTEEVISENGGVTVGHVVTLGNGHIWEISEKCVHRVVLFVSSVKMFSILLDVVATEDVFEEEEAVVIFVVEGGGIIEDSNV